MEPVTIKPVALCDLLRTCRNKPLWLVAYGLELSILDGTPSFDERTAIFPNRSEAARDESRLQSNTLPRRLLAPVYPILQE